MAIDDMIDWESELNLTGLKKGLEDSIKAMESRFEKAMQGIGEKQNTKWVKNTDIQIDKMKQLIDQYEEAIGLASEYMENFDKQANTVVLENRKKDLKKLETLYKRRWRMEKLHQDNFFDRINKSMKGFTDEFLDKASKISNIVSSLQLTKLIEGSNGNIGDQLFDDVKTKLEVKSRTTNINYEVFNKASKRLVEWGSKNYSNELSRSELTNAVREAMEKYYVKDEDSAFKYGQIVAEYKAIHGTDNADGIDKLVEALQTSGAKDVPKTLEQILRYAHNIERNNPSIHSDKIIEELTGEVAKYNIISKGNVSVFEKMQKEGILAHAVMDDAYIDSGKMNDILEKFRGQPDSETLAPLLGYGKIDYNKLVRAYDQGNLKEAYSMLSDGLAKIAKERNPAILGQIKEQLGLTDEDLSKILKLSQNGGFAKRYDEILNEYNKDNISGTKQVKDQPKDLGDKWINSLMNTGFMSNISDYLAKSGFSAGDFIKSPIGSVLTAEALIGLTKGGLGVLKNTGIGIAEWVSEGGLSTVGGAVGKGLQGAGSFIGRTGTAIGGGIKTGVGAGITGLGSVAGALGSTATGALGAGLGAGAILGGAGILAGTGAGILDLGQAMFGKDLKGNKLSTKDRVKKGLEAGSMAGSIGTGAGIGAAIGSVVPVIGTGVGALIGGGIGAIVAFFTKGKVADMLIGFGQGVSDTVVKGWNTVKEHGGKALESGKDFLSKLLGLDKETNERHKKKAQESLDKMKEHIDNLKKNAENFINGLGKGISDFFSGIGKTWNDKLGQFVTDALGIFNSIKGFFGFKPKEPPKVDNKVINKVNETMYGTINKTIEDALKSKGQYRTGLYKVPYDNYNATLHKGERVLTKDEANMYNNAESVTRQLNYVFEKLKNKPLLENYSSNGSGTFGNAGGMAEIDVTGMPKLKYDYQIKRIKSLLPGAIMAKNALGMPISVTLAQGIEEGGWKLSELAEKYHNHFGIKVGGKGYKGKRVSMASAEWGQPGKPVSQFRAYDSDQEGFLDRINWFKERKYVNQLNGDYISVAKVLQKNKYAGNKPDYDSTLINLIRTNRLDWYDNPENLAKVANLPKYAEGNDRVSQDQLALIHKGEMIVPAHKNPLNTGNTVSTGSGELIRVLREGFTYLGKKLDEMSKQQQKPLVVKDRRVPESTISPVLGGI
nr:MAG TPA: Mannosyl-glycoprotein endo-beta-N-acetylglucosaminidase [Caudoviricetes sp.]